MSTTSSIEQQLASLVSIHNLRRAADADRFSGLLPKFVIEPDTEQQLASALAFANQNGLTVIPRGGGTKLHWGNPPKSAGVILSTAKLHRILEHAWGDLTVTVEAGCTLQTLQAALAKRGQRLAVDCIDPARATIGGILSTNDTGVLRIRFGGLRDLIIGVTLALPDGTLASSGGKVVKNVAGYDLPKLATGAFGTLGVITRAVFRLHPLPWMSTTLTCTTSVSAEVQRLFSQLTDSQLAFSALQTRVSVTTKLDFSVDILFEGTEQGIAAQIAQLNALSAPLVFQKSDQNVWQARQQLHAQTAKEPFSAVLKMSTEPANAISALAILSAAHTTGVRSSTVVQATGLGTILLTGDPIAISKSATEFRSKLQNAGGSLVTLNNSLLSADFDAWGDPGDTLPLMRAIKHQLDPNSTLNPGRFAGGI